MIFGALHLGPCRHTCLTANSTTAIDFVHFIDVHTVENGAFAQIPPFAEATSNCWNFCENLSIRKWRILCVSCDGFNLATRGSRVQIAGFWLCPYGLIRFEHSEIGYPHFKSGSTIWLWGKISKPTPTHVAMFFVGSSSPRSYNVNTCLSLLTRLRVERVIQSSHVNSAHWCRQSYLNVYQISTMLSVTGSGQKRARRNVDCVGSTAI